MLSFLSRLASLIMLLFVVRTAIAVDKCVPITGGDDLVGEEIIVIGDIHGTVEPTEIFYDVVCAFAAANTKDRIVIALELPDEFNAPFKKLGMTTQARLAIRAIRQLPFWEYMGDGRHSAAMLEMTVKLAELVATSADRLSLVALERRDIDVEGAKFLDGQMITVNATRSIVLIGNAHARKYGMRGQSSKPFAKTLNEMRGRVVSLNVVPGGGTAWLCTQLCGPVPVPTRDLGPTPRLVVLPCQSVDCAYDGFYYVPHLTISSQARN